METSSATKELQCSCKSSITAHAAHQLFNSSLLSVLALQISSLSLLCPTALQTENQTVQVTAAQVTTMDI